MPVETDVGTAEVGGIEAMAASEDGIGTGYKASRDDEHSQCLELIVDYQ